MQSRPEKLNEQLSSLGKSVVVTHRNFEFPASCGVNDLNWNQIDQDHRPWIHRTYLRAVRIATGPNEQLSLTRIRLLGIPFWVQVTDLRVAPNTYYQGFTLLGFIYVHSVIQCLPDKLRDDWYIVSHRFFKPFHSYLHKRLSKMHQVQNLEDVPIRDRRVELRKKGYQFIHENPDFLTANSKTRNVKPPKIEIPFKVSLRELIAGKTNLLTHGPFEILIRPDGNGSYSVWNGVCPHEGAPLSTAGKVCGSEIQCQWHGLKFDCARLSPDQRNASAGGLTFELDPIGNELTVSSKSS